MRHFLLIPLLIMSLTVSAISAPIVMHYCEMNQKAQKAAKVQRDCCCKSVKAVAAHPKACTSGNNKPAPSKPACCHDREISPQIPSRMAFRADLSVFIPLPVLLPFFVQLSPWGQSVIVRGLDYTDSSPPYLAFYNQTTYLRNDLLLI